MKAFLQVETQEWRARDFSDVENGRASAKNYQSCEVVTVTETSCFEVATEDVL